MNKSVPFLALILLLVPAGRGQQALPAADSPAASARVVVLPPQITFEQLQTNAKVRDFDSASFISALQSTAKTNLGARNFQLVDPASLQNSPAADLLKQLEPLTSRLARGAINDDAQQILGKIAALPDDYLLLVQFVRVKQGPGGSWNPYSGAITSGMSTTSFQAALISTRTGQVTWKNELLERSAFSADSPKFTKCIEQLYSTIVAKGENH